MYMYITLLHILISVSPGVSVTDGSGHSQRGVWESEGGVTETIWGLLTVLATAKGVLFLLSTVCTHLYHVHVPTLVWWTLYIPATLLSILSQIDTSKKNDFTAYTLNNETIVFAHLVIIVTFTLHHVFRLVIFSMYDVSTCACDVHCRCGYSPRGK